MDATLADNWPVDCLLPTYSHLCSAGEVHLDSGARRPTLHSTTSSPAVLAAVDASGRTSSSLEQPSSRQPGAHSQRSAGSIAIRRIISSTSSSITSSSSSESRGRPSFPTRTSTPRSPSHSPLARDALRGEQGSRARCSSTSTRNTDRSLSPPSSCSSRSSRSHSPAGVPPRSLGARPSPPPSVADIFYVLDEREEEGEYLHSLTSRPNRLAVHGRSSAFGRGAVFLLPPYSPKPFELPAASVRVEIKQPRGLRKLKSIIMPYSNIQ